MARSLCLLLLLLLWGCFGQMAPNMRSIQPIGYPCDGLMSDGSEDADECLPEPSCEGFEASRYRTINGSCNNVDHPTWGSSGTPFGFLAEKRLVANPEADMLFTSLATNQSLPDVRKVSIAIHASSLDADANVPRNLSLLVMQFGQFLDHDFALTPQTSACNHVCGAGEGLPDEECCQYLDYPDVPRPAHCWPIRVEEDDPLYGKSRTCLDFKRSKLSNCSGEALPFNLDTHLVDGSNIYGSFEEQARELRAFKGGEMRQNQFHVGYLPYEMDHCESVEDERARPIRKPRNYMGGDIRATENPGLSVLHTVWVTEHNKLAGKLGAAYPSKTDEEIFQEARRYIVAEWQNIAYSEFLELALGKEVVERYGLDVGKDSAYDQNTDPTIVNEFSTAAFRFGHSLITELIHLYKLRRPDDPTAELEYTVKLENNFFNTEQMRKKKMLNLLMGMFHQDAGKADAEITSGVREHLFQKENSTFGDDLPSLNIQRGRDHAIATYSTMRLFCGLPGLNATFETTARPDELPSPHWQRFLELYGSPLDIDLFPAGMAELPVPGGLVGPTFACIIGEQFRRLRLGDRYFFTHAANVGDDVKLCGKELAAIRLRTMRDVICDSVGERMREVPRNPFLVVHPDTNPLEDCTPENVHGMGVADLCPFGGEAPSPPKGKPDEGREVLLVAGGFNGDSMLKKVELYSPDGRCSVELADLPSARYGMLAFTFEGSIFACGGETGERGTACYRYVRDGGVGSWREDREMSFVHPKFMSSMARSPGSGVLFATGGVGDKASARSSEYLDRYTGEWRIGPALGSFRMRHCLVVAGDLKLIVIGGFMVGETAEIYDVFKNEWYAANITHYSDRPACVMIPGTDDAEILIVGVDPRPTIYDRIAGKERRTRGAMIASREFGGVVNLEGEILALGGGFNTDTVERYDPRSEAFSLLPQRLRFGRSRFAQTTVPARWFAHLGCK